jgi:membrane associated rhomboid family serine protease
MLFPFLTSTRLHRIPVVIVGIVIANVVVFLVTRQTLLSTAQNWGFVTADPVGGTFANLGHIHVLETLVTHAFLHAGWAHLLGNMWMLAVFGAALEMRIGSLPFIIVYVLFGILAVLCQGVFQTGPSGPMIGASGAISGVLGCYLALEPRNRVLSLFFVGIGLFLTEVPSLFYMGVWLFLQIDGIQTHFLTGPDFQHIAWWAHLGGFTAGVCVGLLGKYLESYAAATE